MKAFGKLPSSPDIQEMNEAQWLFCYLNIIKDQEEEEELWKSRAKYHGLFVNPEAVKSIAKFEEESKNGQSSSKYNTEAMDDSVYVNTNFEEELKKAMGEDFVEIPDVSEVRGNPNMSSDDFIDMCLMDANSESEYDDLDIIEIND